VDVKCYPDIVVMVDASGSVGLENFGRVMDFLQTALGRLPIAPADIRVAGMMFHKRALPQFTFENPSLKPDILAAFDSWEYPVDKLHGTAIGAALNYVTDNLLTKDHMRPGHDAMVLLITDGVSQETKEFVAAAAERIKAVASRVLVLGISDEVDQEQLQTIASQPSDAYQRAQFDLLEVRSRRMYCAGGGPRMLPHSILWFVSWSKPVNPS